MAVIRYYLSPDHGMNQGELLDELFYSLHAESKEPIIFDGASVNRWLKGTERVSPIISRYYLKKRNRVKLADDIEEYILPLADIGNGTMNILYLVNGQPSESRSWTEKQGVNQCIIAARNAVMDSFGVKIDDSIIEQVLRTGTADIGKPCLECITAVARQYVADLFATLCRYEYNPDLMRLYIVGGGGCLVKHFGDYAKDRVTIIGDLCATAKGYEALCFAQLQRKGQA
ncbi:MAG: hypothetical protein IJD99_12415 [Clostridia bacterium]|nr:hypothetical protein [Clostridia bacterium]